jgi:hypothetical protein
MKMPSCLVSQGFPVRSGCIDDDATREAGSLMEPMTAADSPSAIPVLRLTRSQIAFLLARFVAAAAGVATFSAGAA